MIRAAPPAGPRGFFFCDFPRPLRPFPPLMTDDELQTLIDDATFDHAMGDADAALAKLARATGAAPASFAACSPFSATKSA